MESNPRTSKKTVLLKTRLPEVGFGRDLVEIHDRGVLYRFPGVWDLSLFILLPFSSFFFLLSSSSSTRQNTVCCSVPWSPTDLGIRFQADLDELYPNPGSRIISLFTYVSYKIREVQENPRNSIGTLYRDSIGILYRVPKGTEGLYLFLLFCYKNFFRFAGRSLRWSLASLVARFAGHCRVVWG